MPNRSWTWMWFIAVALCGCTRTTPNIQDATLSALIGAPSFAGKWRCRSVPALRQHWYSRAIMHCSAEAKDSATETLVVTTDEHGRDGVEIASRTWWNRDSTAWMARRDSVVHALLARFPDATPCPGRPIIYGPSAQLSRRDVIDERQGWRSGDYHALVSILGPPENASVYGRSLYMVSLNVTKAPSWILDCGTAAQWSTIPKPRPNTARPDSAH